MKNHILRALLIFFLALPSTTLLAQTTAASSPPFAAETDAARAARIKWWTEARFGMFIHSSNRNFSTNGLESNIKHYSSFVLRWEQWFRAINC